MRLFLYFSAGLLLVRCSSSPPVVEVPSWTRNPARTVDAGYIVYVSKGENASLDQATFQAESIAIGDLANECSFVPKGARVEDRFDELLPGGVHRIWAKLGIVFEECEQAKKALSPSDIQKIANVAMTTELKRYQDLYYTASADSGNSKESTEGDMASVSANEKSLSQVVAIQDHSDYFVVRQRIVYWKQIVVLSPPAYYSENPDRSAHFTSTVTPAVMQLQSYEVSHPTLKNEPLTWSRVQADPSSKLPYDMFHAGPRFEKSHPAVSRPSVVPAQSRQPKRKRRRRS